VSNPDNLSTPAPLKAPRALTERELVTACAVADALIPATATTPSAASEPEFVTTLTTALDARADAFEAITEWLADVADLDGPQLVGRLRILHDSEPVAFQAMSAVLAGAWLLTPTVRARIGYRGQGRNPPSLTEAVDQLDDGLLDAVIERGACYVPTPDGPPAEGTWADRHPEYQGAVSR
jgi:hypothetical protein